MPEPEETPEPETGGEEPEGPDLAAEVAKWKALARKNEAQAKANADAAEKLKQIEDSSKSELERLQEAKSAAEQRAQEAELKAIRAEVMAEKGLTPAQAKRLVGSTKEELEADADELLETFGATPDDEPEPETGGRPPSHKPTPKLKGGNDPDTDPEDDPAEIAEKILSAHRF